MKKHEAIGDQEGDLSMRTNSKATSQDQEINANGMMHKFDY